MAVKAFTCTVCPIGCEITVIVEEGKIVDVKGFGCTRGKDYAVREVLDPRRILVTVIRCRNGRLPTVSVKTDKPIPKGKTWEIMRILSGIMVEAPISMGQVIVRDVADSGADIVATRPNPKSDENSDQPHPIRIRSFRR
jgi:CxxC motif-containing protein